MQTVRGTKTILVVDDEPMQREVTGALLRSLGYRVVDASSGDRALAYLKGKDADLVILDMRMPPGIDGTETYRRILEIKPRQRAIILSGEWDEARVGEAQAMGAGAFVQKPATREMLAAAVREELERQR